MSKFSYHILEVYCTVLVKYTQLDCCLDVHVFEVFALIFGDV